MPIGRYFAYFLMSFFLLAACNLESLEKHRKRPEQREYTDHEKECDCEENTKLKKEMLERFTKDLESDKIKDKLRVCFRDSACFFALCGELGVPSNSANVFKRLAKGMREFEEKYPCGCGREDHLTLQGLGMYARFWFFDKSKEGHWRLTGYGDGK